jgi:hypothetical protein
MGPRNVGRIDHVVAYFWTVANLERAKLQLESALGIADFEEVPDPVGGMRFVVSWDAGIELSAPTAELSEDSPLRQRLEERGEGWHSIVFGVADLAEAEQRATAAGLSPGMTFDTSANHPKFERVIETPLDGLKPISVTLGLFDPVDD